MEESAKKENSEPKAMFESLLKRVLEYATKRRLEASFKRDKGDAMDVNEVGNNEEQWEHWEDPWIAEEASGIPWSLACVIGLPPSGS